MAVSKTAGAVVGGTELAVAKLVALVAGAAALLSKAICCFVSSCLLANSCCCCICCFISGVRGAIATCFLAGDFPVLLPPA